jgi:hypothetical protein
MDCPCVLHQGIALLKRPAAAWHTALMVLVGPIDTDFGIEYLAATERSESGLGRTHINVLDKTVVKTSVLIVTIQNDFNMLDRTGDRKNLCQHILGDTRAQVSNTDMCTSLHFHIAHMKISERHAEKSETIT